MVEEFAGLPETAYDVFPRLEGAPPPSYLHAHRDEHERLIRRPMQLVDYVATAGFASAR